MIIGAVAAAALLTGPPAYAHGDHGLDDEEHARQDLAGVSMATIERETAANARAAAAAGRNTVRTRAATGVVAADDPGQTGTWSAPVATEVLPVFQAVLPNGKVLMWDSVGDDATESYPNHTFTRAMVWNPQGNTFRRVDVQGYNIFCAGYVQLPDGNVLVAGGNKNAALDGIRQTHLFSWQTETWSRGPDMAAERWYPAVAALASGEALIVAGGSGRAEVYQTNGTLRQLTGFTSFADRAYPFLVPRLDGRVELVGPGTQLGTMSTEGAGALVSAGARDGINRDYGSLATYAPGKTLVSGGGSVTEGGQTQVPTRTAVVVDTTGAGTTVSGTNPMAFPRRQHNLTVLADGSVLATGGERRSVNGLVDLANPVLAAEQWRPETGQWTTLASAAKVRQYHSTASLLPDGRVLTGGGGICGACVDAGYLEKNVESFTPPYLYKHDGSGGLATRPTLTGAPTSARVGTRFSATSPVASSIRKVGLVRLGAPTHSVDQGQRYLPLTFSVTGATLDIVAPASANVAPPGYYLLFATNDQGVPSVASTVKILPPAASAALNLALNRPASASSVENAQLGAALADDGSATTRWSSAFSDNQWWQVDLGAAKDVDTVVTSWEAAYAKRFVVQTSLDGTSFTTAATVDTTAAGTQRTTFSARPARYVRIQGVTRGTSWGYSLYEAQVFGSGQPPASSAPVAAAGPDQSVVSGALVTLDGSASTDPDGSALTYRWVQTGGPAVTLSSTTAVRPTFVAPATAGTVVLGLYVNDGTVDSPADTVSVTVSAAPPAAVNLALDRPASASSVEVARFGAALGNDGSATTRWSSAYTDNQWWQVDLGSARAVDTVVTSWEVAYARRFAVQTSLDGTTFGTAATVDAGSAGTQRTTFSARSARYVRIQGITRGTGYGYSLYETQVFGGPR